MLASSRFGPAPTFAASRTFHRTRFTPQPVVTFVFEEHKGMKSAGALTFLVASPVALVARNHVYLGYQ